MTLLAWLGLVLAWTSVGALALQTARGGRVLARIDVSDATRDAARRSLRRGAAIAACVSAAIVAADLLLPALGAGVAGVVVRMLMFAACPLVVFWGGRPLLARGRSESARDLDAPPSVRTASLVAREGTALLPPVWWMVPSALFVTPLAVLAWSALRDGRSFTAPTMTAVVVSLGVAATFFITYGAWAHLAVRAPQDLSGARDPAALDRACAAFRRFLSRGVFLLMTACVAGCAATAMLALALDGDPSQGPALGIAGGVAGSLVGAGGGLLGALADRHRRAILELGGTPPEPGVAVRRAS